MTESKIFRETFEYFKWARVKKFLPFQLQYKENSFNPVEFFSRTTSFLMCLGHSYKRKVMKKVCRGSQQNMWTPSPKSRSDSLLPTGTKPHASLLGCPEWAWECRHLWWDAECQSGSYLAQPEGSNIDKKPGEKSYLSAFQVQVYGPVLSAKKQWQFQLSLLWWWFLEASCEWQKYSLGHIGLLF